LWIIHAIIKINYILDWSGIMKKTTLLDIAVRAGVSKATVSMVLNKKDESISAETRKKIMEITEELGYIPNSVARSLSTNKSGTIGIILPDIINPFFSQMARAIEDEASELEYNVIFCNTDNNSEKEQMYIKLLISKLVDGVILISGGDSTKNVSILKANHIPFVLVDRYIEGYDKEFGVYCKNREGIIEGLKYLYSRGKRKIAFVSGTSKYYIFKERLEGYISFMKEHNIYNPQYISEGEISLKGGMEATEKILGALGDVDAISYSNDIMAMGGIKVLTRRGYKIPEDIAVMGFDNIQMAEFIEPELTTVAQPIYEMGQASCMLLVEHINKDEKERQVFFTPKLIVRGTV
jgi:LacI family transcriptional regulator